MIFESSSFITNAIITIILEYICQEFGVSERHAGFQHKGATLEYRLQGATL